MPGEGFWDRIEAVLRAYLASYHVGQYIYATSLAKARLPDSGYNDYKGVDLARLEKGATGHQDHSRCSPRPHGRFSDPKHQGFSTPAPESE